MIGNCQEVDAVTPWARRLTPAALFGEKSGKSQGLTVPFFARTPFYCGLLAVYPFRAGQTKRLRP